MNEDKFDRLMLMTKLIEIYDRELKENSTGLFRRSHPLFCKKCKALDKQRTDMIMKIKKELEE